MDDLESYRQRMLAERDELSERLTKLSGFINSRAFESVGKPERMRLMRQSVFMRGYLDVLQERIEGWAEKEV